MTETDQTLADRLRQYRPLSRLNDEQRVLLAARAERRQLRAGQVLLEPGTADDRVYFLLAGELQRQPADGPGERLSAYNTTGRQAITLKPDRPARITALQSAEVLAVDQDILLRLLRGAPLNETDKTMPEATDPAILDAGYGVLMRFQADLQSNRLQLPSLPDMARRVREVAARERSGADEVASVINADPAIAAKLVRAANSPLYRGFSDISNTREAVVRLGINTARQLVTVFALRDLFHSTRTELRDAMRALWEHAREVATIAYVLARELPGQDPDQALLAGLLHDIGAIPVIQYAEKDPAIMLQPDSLENLLRDIKGEVGSNLLAHWGFADAFQEAALYAEDWLYDSGGEEPALVDLVLVAQVHSLIGKPEGMELPVMSDMPAFRRLSDLQLTPARSLKVLLAAQERREELKGLLGGA